MANTPESKVKAAVVNILKQYKAYYFFPVANGMGRAGIPDIIVCFNGAFVGIECKAGSNKTTALQDRELQAIVNAKGVALVVNEHTIDHVVTTLELITSRVL